MADLIELSVIEGQDPHATLATVYQWKVEHISGAAKAFVGGGAAVILATLLPLIQQDPAVALQWFALGIAWVSALLLMTLGGMLYLQVRRVHAEYVQAQGLLAELVKLAPFTRTYRSARK